MEHKQSEKAKISLYRLLTKEPVSGRISSNPRPPAKCNTNICKDDIFSFFLTLVLIFGEMESVFMGGGLEESV
jgi:hypothetical protein